MAKKSSKAFLILVAAFFLWACGIQDIPFLYPIPEGNVHRGFLGTTVMIPDSNDIIFTHFAIYYKIYVSDIDSDTPLAIMTAINPTLAQDWAAISPLIDSETAIDTSTDFFRGRRFFLLQVRGANRIDSILDSSVFGTNITFRFPLRGTPEMTVGGEDYALWRSVGPPMFDPRPDRYFRNRPELSEIIDTAVNADVAGRENLTPGARIITYAAMFIVAAGFDHHLQAPIYSTPQLINVFRLSDW